ncbi:hypothetical protein MSG28_002748 [Choristoneura fumiferana]|uniref:Uncharacterized protein n=2 Tax=Choristoneura fumiferana TaxID=7141 RepID=A0ACC0JJE4_CHOFU|nr:hypothetical protein MSG28_002748 [Choristoneura fumiferana]KAI8424157.1 hypothetical protein MSG28_002748 [Choristoneura fumiferana]
MSGMITRAAARAFSTEGLKVVNNVAKQQFSVSLRGIDAVLAYQQSGKGITFVHTDVPQAFQGKGVGKLLAKYAFDHAKNNKLDVICQCHFLAKYYENNISDYKGLNVKLQLE